MDDMISPTSGPASGDPVGVPAEADAGATAAPAGDITPAKRKSDGSFLRELPVLILIAFLLAMLIKTFLVQAFYIPSGSMERTLLIGDRVLVNKLIYRFRDVHRGEVVVFNGLDSFVQDPDARTAAPDNLPERIAHGLGGLVGLAQPGEKDFIKRVVGLPGDTVACCTDGRVTVNGVALDESSYLFEDQPEEFNVVVPDGKIWVMGDHRSQSSDSRANGPVPANRVIGRAFVVVWPVDRAKALRVPDTFDSRLSAADQARSVATSPLAIGLVLATPVSVVRRRRRRVRAVRTAA
jgi:signal peptidase I